MDGRSENGTVGSSGFVPPFPPRAEAGRSVLSLLRDGRRDLLSVFDEGAFRQQVIRVPLLTRTVFVCNSPDTVRQALFGAEGFFDRRAAPMRDALRPLVGGGLLVADGPSAQARRAAAAPTLGRLDAEAVAAAARATRERWRGQAQVDALAETTRLAADALEPLVLGAEAEPGAVAAVRDGFRDARRLVARPDLLSVLGAPGWLPRRRDGDARDAAARVRAALGRIVAARRARPVAAGASLVDRLAAVLDDEAVCDEAAGALLAGQEGLAAVLAWCLYLLSQDRGADARLRAEIAGLGTRAPAQADLPALPYVRAVVEEAMRLYPPLPILAREAESQGAIRHHPVSAGDLVLVVPWLLHRHRQLWDEPDVFRPERFLPDAARPAPLAYLPFGAGPRGCPAGGFATDAAALALATLAQGFRFELAAGAAVMPAMRLTLRPGDALPLVLHPA